MIPPSDGININSENPKTQHSLRGCILSKGGTEKEANVLAPPPPPAAHWRVVELEVSRIKISPQAVSLPSSSTKKPRANLKILID